MILETIRRVYPELTKSQQELSDFITHSYREAAFMTASDLAQRLNLNEATVIRFAQRLGYSGYPELVAAVRELVQQELAIAPGDTDISQDADLELLAAELGNARRMVRSLSTGQIQQAAELLSGASCICVLGQGLSGALAILLGDLLRALGLHADQYPVDSESLATALHDVDARDVLVGISTGEEGSDLVGATLRMARQRGTHTVTITSDRLSPCAQAAEVALIAPCSGESSLPPVTAIAAMIDVLVHALGARDPERIRQRYELIRQTRSEILSLAAERQ